jgi:hypothetical protein
MIRTLSGHRVPESFGNKIPVRVTLTKGFWLGRHEVTQLEWQKIMHSKPWGGEIGVKEGNDYPATYVSWDDAMKFCEKLTKSERDAGRLPSGWKYTLPTEAQWEFACRAGTTPRFSFGDNESDLGQYAWFYQDAQDVGEDYAHRLAKRSGIRGACMTCTETFGSGAAIATVKSWPAAPIRANLPGARSGRTGAGTGTAPPGAPGRRPATGSRRTTGAAAWASASPQFRPAIKAGGRRPRRHCPRWK